MYRWVSVLFITPFLLPFLVRSLSLFSRVFYQKSREGRSRGVAEVARLCNTKNFGERLRLPSRSIPRFNEEISLFNEGVKTKQSATAFWRIAARWEFHPFWLSKKLERNLRQTACLNVQLGSKFRILSSVFPPFPWLVYLWKRLFPLSEAFQNFGLFRVWTFYLSNTRVIFSSDPHLSNLEERVTT